MKAGQRRFPFLGHALVFCLIGLFTLSPVIWLAIVNAQSPGEAIGLPDLMAQWGVLGWLVMTPMALGPLLFLVWSIVAAVHLIVHMRKRMGGRP